MEQSSQPPSSPDPRLSPSSASLANHSTCSLNGLSHRAADEFEQIGGKPKIPTREESGANVEIPNSRGDAVLADDSDLLLEDASRKQMLFADDIFTRGDDLMLLDHSEVGFIKVPKNGNWMSKFWAYVGPGFLVAIAYIDPANFESDLQAGARFKYQLLWVLLLASLGGLLIQSLSAKLGVVTGKHLAQHCRYEYPSSVNILLWIIAEMEIIASDIPEVIGSAFALNMLFGLALWKGVVLTGFSTMMLLAVQKYGIRQLEIFIASLVLVVACCFFMELTYVKLEVVDVLKGMIFPSLESRGAIAIAISIVGAVVMPHNLFLHSALVLSRRHSKTDKAIRDACLFTLIEVAAALFIAFLINVSIICVGGAVCNDEERSGETQRNCEGITLNNAYFLLQNTLGHWSSALFGVALLASGQSSTITGTYAGQYVMAGFLNLRMKTWLRNLLTRLMAIVPSLLVVLLSGQRGAGNLIILSSMILSFGLPFSLIPLLKFTGSELKMGPHVNSAVVSSLAWLTSSLVILINVFFLLMESVRWIQQTDLDTSALVPAVIFLFAGIVAYITLLVYLSFRPTEEVTYFPPNALNLDFESDEGGIEAGLMEVEGITPTGGEAAERRGVQERTREGESGALGSSSIMDTRQIHRLPSPPPSKEMELPAFSSSLSPSSPRTKAGMQEYSRTRTTVSSILQGDDGTQDELLIPSPAMGMVHHRHSPRKFVPLE